MTEKTKNLLTTFRVALFLAWRDIKRANIWTTLLISFVLALTFLNLIVVSGILVGLVQGSEDASRGRYTGDAILSTLREKSYIEGSNFIINTIEAMPEVSAVSPRFMSRATIEANYKSRTRLTDIVNSAGGVIAGIDPAAEDAVTSLGSYIVEGSYLEPGDYDQILVGSNLLYKYSATDSPGITTLRDVEAGSRVRLKINGFVREVTIKGIVKTKVGEVDLRIFMNNRQLQQLIGRDDSNVGEIAVTLKDKNAAPAFRDALMGDGLSRFARIQTWDDAQPKFLKDIKATFGLLGNMIGSIGLAVASITIFIVIFVNAITRRRYIGIMKGIGISRTAIEFSYIMQSLFYATVGMTIGSIIVFAMLQPFIAAHPINFPFSDGILVATALGTLVRAGILFVTTIIAGYVPARIVVKQNTLDAILGR